MSIAQVRLSTNLVTTITWLHLIMNFKLTVVKKPVVDTRTDSSLFKYSITNLNCNFFTALNAANIAQPLPHSFSHRQHSQNVNTSVSPLASSLTLVNLKCYRHSGLSGLLGFLCSWQQSSSRDTWKWKKHYCLICTWLKVKFLHQSVFKSISLSGLMGVTEHWLNK